MADFLSNLLGIGTGIVGGGLLKGAYDNLEDVGNEAKSYGDKLATTLSGMAGFKPFNVSSGIGTGRTNADGSLQLNLSQPYQQQSNTLQGYANTLFGNAMGNTADREADVYNRIRALQRPEEQRQLDTLNNRLAGQGRAGVITNAYGGTPEQLAMQKAIAEGKNQASIMAIQQAMADQAQNATIGTQFMQNQFLPYAQMLDQQTTGLQGAALADLARRQAAGLFGEASMSGMEQKLAAQLGQGSLLGNLGQGLLGGVLSPFQTADGDIASIFGNAAGGIWKSVFKSED